ncbi:MAG: ATP-binding protein [Planctomycetaceae bacterium]
MATAAPFRSLRTRLLGGLITASMVTAVIVAVASYWLGAKWTRDDVQARLTGIRRTLADPRFPLNATVLDSLADLTQTELVALSQSGVVLQSTLDRQIDYRLEIAGGRYQSFRFEIADGPIRADRVSRIEVLFDEDRLAVSRRRAAILPLVTGLSTIIALSSITLLYTSRLIGRIAKLQRRVEAISGGDFQSTVADEANDEVGRLDSAVNSMAGQLDQLWKRIHRQQSERLLHQIASGMAHQLRNSLTGARMAVELHASECKAADDESLTVAIRQIELAEDYVRRLVLVASGHHDQDRPASVTDCWNDVRSSFSPIAKHLHIEVQWQIDAAADHYQIKDGPTLVAAVTNLLHNAMQAGKRVRVDAAMIDDARVRIRVADDGPGVLDSVADELFEPFVTSKPEGMGLGLSVVRRAAEYLGGSVQWRRDDGWTVFELIVSTIPKG